MEGSKLHGKSFCVKPLHDKPLLVKSLYVEHEAPDLVIMHRKVCGYMCFPIPIDCTIHMAYGTVPIFFNTVFQDHKSFVIKRTGYIFMYHTFNVFTKKCIFLRHNSFSKKYLQFDSRSMHLHTNILSSVS